MKIADHACAPSAGAARTSSLHRRQQEHRRRIGEQQRLRCGEREIEQLVDRPPAQRLLIGRRDSIERRIDTLELRLILPEEVASSCRSRDLLQCLDVDLVLPSRLRIADAHGIDRDALLPRDVGGAIRRHAARCVVAVRQHDEHFVRRLAWLEHLDGEPDRIAERRSRPGHPGTVPAIIARTVA